jgi:hypothetical protein
MAKNNKEEILNKKPSKKEIILTDEISTDTWVYNDKGHLLEVKLDWDKVYLKKYKEDIEFQRSLPKYKRQYLNPENGKYVGYARAKALGFFEDEDDNE